MPSFDNGTGVSGEVTLVDVPLDLGDSGSSSEGSPLTDSSGVKYFKAFGRKKLGENVEKWLLKLGYLLMYLDYITSTGVTPSMEDVISSTFLYAVQVAVKRTIEELEFTIPKLARLAEEAAGTGENAQADRIFGRLFNCVKCAVDLGAEVRCSALSKMISFYQKLGDEPQFQQALRILSSLSKSDNSDLGMSPDEMLAQSFLKTSRLMSTTIARKVPSIGPAIHSPALHQSIGCPNPEVFKAVLNAITHNPGGFRVSELGKHLSSDPSDPNKDLEGRDTLGRTALFLACWIGDENKAEALIYSGARVNERDCHGHTILGVAAQRGLMRTVQALHSWQADVNPNIFSGESTPLQGAAEHGHLEVVQFLLSVGAKVNVKRSDRKTAAGLATENGHEAIFNELVKWCDENPHQAATNNATPQELQPSTHVAQDHTPEFLPPAQSNQFPLMHDEMDGLMTAEDSHGFSMDCMNPGDAFPPNGQTFGDFFLGDMVGACPELSDFDRCRPHINQSFELSGLLPDVDMRS